MCCCIPFQKIVMNRYDERFSVLVYLKVFAIPMKELAFTAPLNDCRHSGYHNCKSDIQMANMVATAIIAR